jgi:lipopolysaccharide cholinephosphotransferase
MENTKSLNNQFFCGRAMSDNETERLKSIIYTILCDFASACESQKIIYSLTYGSLLGAKRHQGFIPWDDDIDVTLLRNDFDRLPEIMESCFPGKYLVRMPGQDKNDPIRFAKIMIKNTTFLEIEYEGLAEKKNFWRGISIDVYPLDYVPNSPNKQKSWYRHCCFYGAAGGAERDFKYPSKSFLETSKENRSFKKQFKKRRIIGFFYSVLPTRFWIRKFEKYVKKWKPSNFVGFLSSPFDLPKATILPIANFLNSKPLRFGKRDFLCFDQPDVILTNFYGDWETIPENAGKEKHIIYKIDFGK